MICPNCQYPRLLTTETFSMPEKTYRTKKCPACGWKYTSHEVIAEFEEQGIPNSIRKAKRLANDHT